MTNRTSGSGPIAANAQRFISLPSFASYPAVDPEGTRSLRKTGYLQIDTSAGPGGDVQWRGLAPGSAGQELLAAINEISGGGNDLKVHHWDSAAEYGWKMVVPNLLPGTASSNFYRFVAGGTLRMVYVVPLDTAVSVEPYWRVVSASNIAVAE